MELIRPDFSDPLLRVIVACGYVELADAEPIRGLENSVRLQASYQTENGEVAMRLIIDSEGGPGRCHFHVDAGSPESLSGEGKCEIVDTAKIDEVATRFAGLEVDVSVSAEYSVSINELPELGVISSLLAVRTRSCDAEMSMSGAVLEIAGGGFSRMRWEREAEDSICVSLTGRRRSRVGPTYLVDFVEEMRRGLSCFVFEDETVTYAGLLGNNEDSVPGSVEAR